MVTTGEGNLRGVGRRKEKEGLPTSQVQSSDREGLQSGILRPAHKSHETVSCLPREMRACSEFCI